MMSHLPLGGLRDPVSIGRICPGDGAWRAVPPALHRAARIGHVSPDPDEYAPAYGGEGLAEVDVEANINAPALEIEEYHAALIEARRELVRDHLTRLMGVVDAQGSRSAIRARPPAHQG